MKSGPAEPRAPELHVLRLAAHDAAAVAPWRLTPGLEVRPGEGEIWLRLRAAGGEAERVLAALPALERFTCDAQGALRRRGGLVPRGRMVEEGWQPVAEWSGVMAGLVRSPQPVAPSRSALRLERREGELPAVAVLLRMADWCAYAVSAPQVRLARWRLAASRAEQAVLVVGLPLPPLPGGHFVAAAERILLPAGFGWTPAIDAIALRQVVGAARTDYVWWREREGLAVLPEALFVPASRSGARQLAEGGA